MACTVPVLVVFLYFDECVCKTARDLSRNCEIVLALTFSMYKRVFIPSPLSFTFIPSWNRRFIQHRQIVGDLKFSPVNKPFTLNPVASDPAACFRSFRSVSPAHPSFARRCRPGQMASPAWECKRPTQPCRLAQVGLGSCLQGSVEPFGTTVPLCRNRPICKNEGGEGSGVERFRFNI